MRPETPYPDGMTLLTGHERRTGNWCWRPRGTPIPLLVHTRSGQGLLRVSGSDNDQVIATGDTILWAPGAPQDFGCSHGRQPWEIVWAHFRPRTHWHDWLTWPILGPGVARIPSPLPRVRARVDAALLEMDSAARGASPRTADFALNALERALLWLDAASPGPRQLDDRVHDAVLFVASHLDHPLSVAAIADAVQLSPRGSATSSRTSSESRPRGTWSCVGSSALRACSSRPRCPSVRSRTPPASAASSTSRPASVRWPA